MLTVDYTKLRKLETALKGVREQALPFATRFSLNETAFQARGYIQQEARTKLTLRNKFTERSIMVDKTTTLNISKQQAIVGTTAEHMPKLEFGETKIKKGTEGIPMATSYSSGEGLNNQPRKRLPRSPNRMKNIQLRTNKKKGRSKKQQSFVAVRMAKKTGRKFVFLDLDNGRKGIFRVVGSKNRPEIKMVHDLSKSSATIAPRPMFGPGSDRAFERMPQNYERALVFQLRRWGFK